VFNATRYDPVKGMDDEALRQLDFDEQPEAEADHGTAAAGIIAAHSSNGIGVSGVAPGVKIVAIQIARPSTSDVKVVSGLTMIAALEAARAAGAHVVSLSWSLRLPNQEAFDSVRAEIDVLNQARDRKGIVIVSAAGNDRVNIPAPDFPADYADRAPNLIAAGASNWCGEMKKSGHCDQEAWSSRFNDQTLFAPGVEILTTTNRRDRLVANALQNYRVNFNGTSAATPFIAAAAALVMKLHPDWTAAQVRKHLTGTADKLYGGGQAELDICNALYNAKQCALPPPGP
jgi:subtilisin family serine protease